jgi:hypothetical protein
MRGTVFAALSIFLALTVLVIAGMILLMRRSGRNMRPDR